MASSSLSVIEEKLAQYEQNGKSLAPDDAKTVLTEVRTSFDSASSEVEKMVAKAEAGEKDPTKRTYGPGMTTKIRGLETIRKDLAKRLEEAEEGFKAIWSTHVEELAQKDKLEKERIEKEERERKERKEKERLELERKQNEERLLREKEEKERLEREKKAREEKERIMKEKMEQEKKAEEARKEKERLEKIKQEEMAKTKEKEKQESQQVDRDLVNGIQISIKTAAGKSYSLKGLSAEITVKDLKQTIERQENIPVAAQRLIFRGRLLTDAKKIAEFNITNGCTIHLVENSKAAASSSSRTTPTASQPRQWVVPSGTVQELTGGAEEFSRISNDCGKQRLLVVDWSAAWCGPCRAIEPTFKRLATRYSDVTFVKVDTEKTPGNAQLAAEKGISAYPTFHFYVSGVLVHQFPGANATKIENGIKKGRLMITKANVSQAASGSGNPSGSRLTQRVLEALRSLSANCSQQEFVVASRTLLAYVRNVVEHPGDPKYRKVRTANNTFQTRIGNRVGGMECMRAFGFESVQESGETFLVLEESAATNPELLVVKQQLETALSQASGSGPSNASTTTPRTNPTPRAPGGVGGGNGMQGVTGGGMGGTGFPQFPGAPGGMPNVDPALFNEMMNDPGFMQLAMEMGSDSNMQAALMEAQAAMQSGDMEAISRLMANPAMSRIMQTMMNSPSVMNAIGRQLGRNGMPGAGPMGMGGMMGGGFGAQAPPGPQPGGNTANPNNAGQGTNQPQYPGAPSTQEEEDRLLQEAIRLSMQDQGKPPQQNEPKKEDGQGGGQG